MMNVYLINGFITVCKHYPNFYEHKLCFDGKVYGDFETAMENAFKEAEKLLNDVNDAVSWIQPTDNGYLIIYMRNGKKKTYAGFDVEKHDVISNKQASVLSKAKEN